ncbi:nicotinate-nucleotide--dimethylbenzimidazole phosphoribosyltransferase [Thermospira aquatica]|uniref:Nicotinate-nucleotide--dimethylbenzimidazole phosphoribosyltransferase n=1 Tax=Thermospira aquatica TaxID=2828656 RepID=A0AAX3BAP3_9SPIR|nr:nicotinate-nucleotide--dimethylbenzimidazole phosphoribosyltransferase [Thermospira aquatica]URA09347.1 nicotinate-nucleotide--dimethylbenzimidazole phosphoribosyltransferase [Thermospira aquatica]
MRLVEVKPVDRNILQQARKKMDNKTKPLGSLGMLEEIACRVAAIQKTLTPFVREVVVVVFAGDHGIVEEGVSLYPQEVTGQMVANFLRGGAAVNVFAREVGAKLLVADMGVKGELPSHPALINCKVRSGSRNFLREQALTREEVETAVRKGIEIASEYGKDADVLIAGEMGIGNTSSATLLLSGVCGIPVKVLVGRGTGLDDTMLRHKAKVLSQSFHRRRFDRHDPFSLLEAFGGLEIAGMVGFYLGAAALGKVFVVDGFIATAAYAIAKEIEPLVKEYAFLAHLSAEQGHRRVVEKLGLFPILQLGMRLGEGTGAVLTVPLLRAAVRALSEMASFDDAAVSRAKKNIKIFQKTLDFFGKYAII